MDVIRVNKSAITAVEDYIEYRRIVGEDDGGRPFTSEQYEAYKRHVLPARLQNRLYVSCGVPGGVDCKLIGPETLCFCSHRYKQHQTDFEKLPVERPLALPCRVRGCRCASYSYVHLNGSHPVRCRCKHSVEDHSEAGEHPCRKCSTCAVFHSPYTCSCSQPSYAHKTLVETKEEHLARGRPVGKDVPYVAMGGLTGFSSLAEGYMRLDNSGLGGVFSDMLGSCFRELFLGRISDPLYSGLELAGSRSALEYGFEKANGAFSQTAESVPQFKKSSSAEPRGRLKLSKAKQIKVNDNVSSLKQGKSDLKMREEEDMAVFERRYKERLEMEKVRKQRCHQ